MPRLLLTECMRLACDCGLHACMQLGRQDQGSACAGLLPADSMSYAPCRALSCAPAGDVAQNTLDLDLDEDDVQQVGWRAGEAGTMRACIAAHAAVHSRRCSVK